jgi:benzodiazapine receptor
MPTKYILLVSAIISVIFSGLATIIPLGAFDQGEVSALYPTLFTPAVFTFSIWSIIYLSWVVIWIFQALQKIMISRENAILLWAAQILSSLWLIPSQYLFTGSSLIVMAGVLYLLFILFYESRTESLFFKWVVDLFLWWIIVASLANLHLVLVSYEIYFFPLQLTIISIVLGLLINMYLIIKYKSFIPSLVLVWALVWIIAWQDALLTQLTAAACITWVAATLAYTYVVHKK